MKKMFHEVIKPITPSERQRWRNHKQVHWKSHRISEGPASHLQASQHLITWFLDVFFTYHCAQLCFNSQICIKKMCLLPRKLFRLLQTFILVKLHDSQLKLITPAQVPATIPWLIVLIILSHSSQRYCLGLYVSVHLVFAGTTIKISYSRIRFYVHNHSYVSCFRRNQLFVARKNDHQSNLLWFACQFSTHLFKNCASYTVRTADTSIHSHWRDSNISSQRRQT